MDPVGETLLPADFEGLARANIVRQANPTVDLDGRVRCEIVATFNSFVIWLYINLKIELKHTMLHWFIYIY